MHDTEMSDEIGANLKDEIRKQNCCANENKKKIPVSENSSTFVNIQELHLLAVVGISLHRNSPNTF